MGIEQFALAGPSPNDVVDVAIGCAGRVLFPVHAPSRQGFLFRFVVAFLSVS